MPEIRCVAAATHRLSEGLCASATAPPFPDRARFPENTEVPTRAASALLTDIAPPPSPATLRRKVLPLTSISAGLSNSMAPPIEPATFSSNTLSRMSSVTTPLQFRPPPWLSAALPITRVELRRIAEISQPIEPGEQSGDAAPPARKCGRAQGAARGQQPSARGAAGAPRGTRPLG